MQLTREILLEKVEESPMIPVFNHSDKDVALEIVRACYQGGARLFEFTNRSKEAMHVFKHLLSNQNEYPDMIIGHPQTWRHTCFLHGKVLPLLNCDWLI